MKQLKSIRSSKEFSCVLLSEENFEIKIRSYLVGAKLNSGHVEMEELLLYIIKGSVIIHNQRLVIDVYNI